VYGEHVEKVMCFSYKHIEKIVIQTLHEFMYLVVQTHANGWKYL